ncbi:MAG: methylmalonyl-CoA mutase family protein [Polyangiaceae bacterium]
MAWCAPSKAATRNARIALAAYEFEQKLGRGERTIVGVNAFQQAGGQGIPTLRIDPSVEQRQVSGLARVKAARDASAVAAALLAVKQAAEDGSNLVPRVVDAARAYATLGEVCDVLRSVFGTYTDPAVF